MEDRSPFLEWRIQNFSCWMISAHGISITCETPYPAVPGSIRLSLYPRGHSGDDNRLKVTYKGPKNLLGDLTYVGPDGSSLYEGYNCMKATTEGYNCTLYEVFDNCGPLFREVVSRIEQNEDLHGDHLTLKFRSKEPREHQIYVTTTLDVLDTSLKITQPSLLRDRLVTIASVSYHNRDSNVERMLVIYHTERFLFLKPAQENSRTSVKYRLSVFNRSNVLVRQVKNEHILSESFGPKVLDSALESGGHCILHLKIMNGLYTSHFSDFFHSTFPLHNAPKSIQEIGVSESSNTLREDLRTLYQDREYSDFQLKCGDITFPVHRSILSARSPVFKAMLSSDMREAVSGSVDIEDMDAPDLELFLEFLYTGTLKEMSGDSALKLYYAADKYQVPSLMKECVHHLSKDIGISNVCDILCLGDRHGDEQLTSAAQEFILNNYNDVLKSKEWESFMCGYPLLAVKMLTHFASKDRVVRKHQGLQAPVDVIWPL